MLAGENKYKPVPVTFSPEVMKQLYKYVEDHIRSLNTEWSDFHKQKLPKERDLYKGKPKEDIKSFPWRNASNIVIQLVGQHVDTLKARIISSVYELLPIWTIGVLGEWDDSEQIEEQRKVFEDYMSNTALDPTKLDFYRVESLWCSDMLKHGMGVIKSPLENDIEVSYLSLTGADGVESNLVKYYGPKPVKIELESFSATSTCPTLEDAPFKKHRIPLTKNGILERKYKGIYDKDQIEKILKMPDRGGPTPEQVEEYQKKGLDIQELLGGAQWDIDECWFYFWNNNKKYRIICTYHLLSNTPLRTVFNFYPDNAEPFIMARLGYDEDGLKGRGFADVLKDYQEDVSCAHNQRNDNRTLANTAIIRVPKNGRFDSQFTFYPGMTIPADQNELEPMQVGAVYGQSVNEEMMTIKLAEDRVGSGPSTAGSGGLGSGTVGKTNGAYSSMGTYATMQDSGKRVGVNITDFKYAHIKAGILFAKMNGHFGIGGDEKQFGENQDLLMQALESFTSKKIGFEIRGATASINKEVEKQNYLLLSGVMQRHYTAIGQMIQAIQNQQTDPILKQYLIETVKAANLLASDIIGAFAMDDAGRYVPKTIFEEGANQNGRSRNGRASRNSGPVIQGSAAQNPGAEQLLPPASIPQGGNPELALPSSVGTSPTILS